MQDIADRAGVTRAAVSMALRNHPRIGAATRQRIQQIAAELGYRPNPMISALMANLRTGRSDSPNCMIAVVISREWDLWRRSPLARKLDEGIVERATALGYGIDYLSLRDLKGNAARLSQVLFARGIQGLIITSFLRPTPSLPLEWDHFSAVMLDYSISEPVLHRICNNQFHTITLIMDQVVRRGCRRVGMCIQKDTDVRIDHVWEAGFLLHQQRFPRKNRIPAQLVPKHERRLFLEWAAATRPDVVLSDSLDVWGWIRSAKLPCDYVHMQWTPESGDCAGIDQNFDLVGGAAVDALVGMIHRNERGVPDNPKTIMVEGTWREGASLNRLPAPV
jgi:DNA-binding LacI/PurR family transcriptional regulator